MICNGRSVASDISPRPPGCSRRSEVLLVTVVAAAAPFLCYDGGRCAVEAQEQQWL